MTRPVCPRCRLPRATCLCPWVTPTDNRLPLLLLQHPQEAHQAKGSARLLGLSLRHCRCVVGQAFDEAALAALLGPDGSSLLLLPPDPGPPAPGRADPPCPSQLVLLDGTWRQARQLLRAHPRLQALARWALPAPPPSRYLIRRAQRPLQQRSTLEAACLALGELEGRPDHYAALLSAFSGWVAKVDSRRCPPKPATVTAVHRKAQHGFSKDAAASIELVAGHGVRDDAHFGLTVRHRSRVARDPTQPNLRQVHLLHQELFDELGRQGLTVGPGQMGENLTTQGLDLLSLATGTLLRLGPSAVVQVTGLRNPCAQIESFKPGLLAAVLGRAGDGALVRKAGVMAIVVTSGEVSPGDAITVMHTPAHVQPLQPV